MIHDAYEYLKSEANNFYRTIYPFMHFKIKNELVLFDIYLSNYS